MSNFVIDPQVLREDLARRGLRLDANESVMLARQLEHVYAQAFEVQYAELKARRFIPVDTSVDSAAEFFIYQMWDQFGMAKIISNYADDLPRVDLLAEEFPQKIKSLGASYGYSLMDLRRSVRHGIALDAKRARVARKAHEQAVDDIAATGNAAAGLPGFLNNSNVPTVSPDNAPWSAATSLEILADMNKLVESVVTATEETIEPDTLLLDRASFSIINTKPMSATGDTSKTVLKYFLENNPYIKNIDQWNKLNTAGAGSTTRLVAYRRHPDVVALVIPQEFEQLPPEQRNMEYVVNTHSRIGGVRTIYPLGIAYMDGTGA